MHTKFWSENIKEGHERRSEDSVRMIVEIVGWECVGGLVHSVQNMGQ